MVVVVAILAGFARFYYRHRMQASTPARLLQPDPENEPVELAPVVPGTIVLQPGGDREVAVVIPLDDESDAESDRSYSPSPEPADDGAVAHGPRRLPGALLLRDGRYKPALPTVPETAA